jgi:hypothetical protein
VNRPRLNAMLSRNGSLAGNEPNTSAVGSVSIESGRLRRSVDVRSVIVFPVVTPCRATTTVRRPRSQRIRKTSPGIAAANCATGFVGSDR